MCNTVLIVIKGRFPLRELAANVLRTWSRTRSRTRRLRESATCRRQVADLVATCREPAANQLGTCLCLRFFLSRVRLDYLRLLNSQGRF